MFEENPPQNFLHQQHPSKSRHADALPFRPWDEWSFWKDHYFSRDLQSTIPGDYYFNGRFDLQGEILKKVTPCDPWTPQKKVPTFQNCDFNLRFRENPDLRRFGSRFQVWTSWSSPSLKFDKYKTSNRKRKNKQILVAKDLTSNFFEGNLAFVIFILLFLECVGFDFVVSPISFPGTGPQRWNSGVFPLFYPQFPLSKVSLKRCWKIIKHEDWLRNPNIPPLEAIIEVDYTSIRWSSVAM